MRPVFDWKSGQSKFDILFKSSKGPKNSIKRTLLDQTRLPSGLFSLWRAELFYEILEQ